MGHSFLFFVLVRNVTLKVTYYIQLYEDWQVKHKIFTLKPGIWLPSCIDVTLNCHLVRNLWRILECVECLGSYELVCGLDCRLITVVYHVCVCVSQLLISYWTNFYLPLLVLHLLYKIIMTIRHQLNTRYHIIIKLNYSKSTIVVMKRINQAYWAQRNIQIINC